MLHIPNTSKALEMVLYFIIMCLAIQHRLVCPSIDVSPGCFAKRDTLLTHLYVRNLPSVTVVEMSCLQQETRKIKDPIHVIMHTGASTHIL